MRSVPIITIIRRYGLSSKRLNPKNRIKYEDAIKAVRQYESSSLMIDDVIDNTRKTSHNNCHCGIKGCGQKIRYEYILKEKDKKDSPELVAGSTCVWPTLGFSELEKKNFFKLDQAIRDHYDLLDWKDENPEVVRRLEILKEHNITYYKAFWREIETAPLLKEDTDFIMGIDIDKEVEKAMYKERMKEVKEEDYQRAVSYIPKLKDFYKTNTFVQNLSSHVESGRRLSGSQFRWLKVFINRMWFSKNIEGTDKDFYGTCESMLKEIFHSCRYYGGIDFDRIYDVETRVKNEDSNIRMAWVAYKVKHGIVQ